MTGTIEAQSLKMAPNRNVKVYIASKLRHAELFRDLRKEWPQLHFTSRWIVTAPLASESLKPVPHWLQDNFDDIARSEAVICYVEKDEHLKGALVEVGYALACGKPVYCIGDHEDYSKWQFFAPLVHRRGTIAEALKDILRMGEYGAGG